MPYELGMIILMTTSLLVIATIGNVLERTYNALTK